MTLLDSWHDADGHLWQLPLPPDQLARWHGQKARKKNELACFCPECHDPVHPFKFLPGIMAVRHNPNSGDRCQLVDWLNRQTRTTSIEHANTCARIGINIRSQPGWNAEPEKEFRDGDLSIRPDVHAWPDLPTDDKQPANHEIQFTRQTYITTALRTQERDQLTGAKTIWWTDKPGIVTADAYTAWDDHVHGIIIDKAGRNIVARAYTSLDPPTPAELTVKRAARALVRDRQRWALIPNAVDLDQCDILVPEAIGSTVEPRKARAPKTAEVAPASGCNRTATNFGGSYYARWKDERERQFASGTIQFLNGNRSPKRPRVNCPICGDNMAADVLDVHIRLAHPRSAEPS